MSDEATPDMELLDTAKAELADALGRYADGWSTTEGGIVTAFVALAEVSTPDGSRAMIEIRGAGRDGHEMLFSWQRKGLLFEALYDDRVGEES